jgi:hypothetical protein
MVMTEFGTTGGMPAGAFGQRRLFTAVPPMVPARFRTWSS